MNAIEKRFNNDPIFHAVVCSMLDVLDKYQLTPSEMREAAMLACVRFEQRRTAERVVYKETNSCIDLKSLRLPDDMADELIKTHEELHRENHPEEKEVIK